MKNLSKSFVVITVCGTLFIASCGEKSNVGHSETKTIELSNASDSASFAYGILIGAQIAEKLDAEQLSSRIDPRIFAEGVGKSLGTSVEPYWSTTFSDSVMVEYYEGVLAELSAKNSDAGSTFLEENKSKAGVVTTESGLQYIVLQEGEGNSPTAADQVLVHYTGKLLNGEVFDSSYDRNQPVTFYVRSVIPGWTEALQLMKPGAEYKLFIPSDLAYGEQGNPRGGIGPNEVLIFDVKLIDIVKE